MRKRKKRNEDDDCSWSGSRVEASRAKPSGRDGRASLRPVQASPVDVAPLPTLSVLGAVDGALLEELEAGKGELKRAAFVGQQLPLRHAARSRSPSSPSYSQTVAPRPEFNSLGAGLVGDAGIVLGEGGLRGCKAVWAEQADGEAAV